MELRPVPEEFSLFGKTVVPLPVFHGDLEILGYRFGELAYITDASRIPDPTCEKMAGIRLLIINALRYRPHSTHFSVEEAVRAATATGAQTVRFVHIAHQVDHEVMKQGLPPGYAPGRDGETLLFNW